MKIIINKSKDVIMGNVREQNLWTDNQKSRLAILNNFVLAEPDNEYLVFRRKLWSEAALTSGSDAMACSGTRFVPH